MFARLLATSLTMESASSAHPSFASVIEQLMADEARILLWLNKQMGKRIPCFRLWAYQPAEPPKQRLMVDIFSTCSELAKCEAADNHHLYLDNLMRLKLIDYPEGMKLVDNDRYTEL